MVQPTGRDRQHSGFIPFGIVFLVAAGLRLSYLWEIRDFPLVRAPVSDSRLYYEWAGKIAAGDWRGESDVFYQAPGYAYFLGGLRALFTNDLLSLRVLQAILGGLSAALLVPAATSFLGRRSGLAAGLLLACSAPAIFFDGLLHKPVLVTFLTVVLMVILGRGQRSPRVLTWLAAGLTLGLLAITSENTLLLGLVIPIWIMLRFREEPHARRFRWIAVFLLGMALPLAPVTWRNYSAGGEFVLVTANMGPNLYIGNHPGASGTYEPLLPDRQDPRHERQDATRLAESARGHSLSSKEVSDYWTERTWSYVREQPLSWLTLLAKKAFLVWNDRELTDADDFYLYEEQSLVLTGLARVIGFGGLLALSALGFVLTWGRRKDLSILYAMIVSLSSAITFFFVFARYRFVIVPALIVLGGGGLARVREALGAGSRRRLALGFAAFASALVITHLPVSGTRETTVSSLVNLSIAAFRLEHFDDAERYAGRALAMSPGCIPAMYQQAKARRRKGDLRRALEDYERVLRLSPKHAGALLDMGLMYLEANRLDEALSCFSGAIQQDPDNPSAQNNMAIALSRSGRNEEAEVYAQRAIELDPRDPNAHVSLGAIRLSRGDPDAAIRCFNQALALDPGNHAARVNLSMARASSAKRRPRTETP